MIQTNADKNCGKERGRFSKRGSVVAYCDDTSATLQDVCWEGKAEVVFERRTVGVMIAENAGV